jgi:hypothetical protein
MTLFGKFLDRGPTDLGLPARLAAVEDAGIATTRSRPPTAAMSSEDLSRANDS